jgi:hypothetical protein
MKWDQSVKIPKGGWFAPASRIGQYIRSFAAEARSSAAIDADIRQTRRLERLQCIPVSKKPPVRIVDLASRGSLSEPALPPFPSWRLLQTNATKIAADFTERLRRFAHTNPENLVAMTLRPPMSLKDDDGALLTEDGLVPVDKYDRAHRCMNNIVQRMLADLERRGGFVAYALARHPRVTAQGKFESI